MKMMPAIHKLFNDSNSAITSLIAASHRAVFVFLFSTSEYGLGGFPFLPSFLPSLCPSRLWRAYEVFCQKYFASFYGCVKKWSRNVSGVTHRLSTREKKKTRTQARIPNASTAQTQPSPPQKQKRPTSTCACPHSS